MTGMPDVDAISLNRLFRLAVLAGVEGAVKVHIQRGDDLNARDGNGFTPLMLAAMRNKPGVCAILLSSGADPNLVDRNGCDALSHARQARAAEAYGVIQSAASLACSEGPLVLVSDNKTPPLPPSTDPANVDVTTVSLPTIKPSDERVLYKVATHFPSLIPEIAGIFDQGENAFVLSNTSPDPSITAPTQEGGGAQPAGQNSDWEPEVEPMHGADDPDLAVGAATVQIAISDHKPFDSSADWDDLDLYLPIASAPMRRADDAEARATLRLLMLRAIREGSVPDMAVLDATTNDDRSENLASASLLRMVINDLGAETDERMEYSDGNDRFEVFTQSEESPDEEDIVSDAIAFIDAHESNHHDPLRLYQREFQRGKLISADEEVSIAKTMEDAISTAVDALATWPKGIDHVIACGELVRSGAKPIQWISGGAREDAPAETSEPESAETVAILGEIDEPDSSPSFENEGQPFLSETQNLFEKLNRLSEIVKDMGRGDADVKDSRTNLVALSLKGSFLMGMIDIARNDRSKQALLFASAMVGYQQARDRMAVANLKLVASIAKSFLYTGLPLEDLIQDGNVGLLRAVEKYDWRKGFRFSTYATWWIRQGMYRSAADTSRTIRLPVHVFEVVQRIRRAHRDFEQTNRRAPTTKEVAEILCIPASKVTAFIRIAQDIHSLDKETIDDLISPSSMPEYTMPDPFELVAAIDTRRVLDGMLAELSPNQERILRWRFGLGVSDESTLEQIGIRFGVTRERIRQIESKALRVLKHPARAAKLHGMLYGDRPLVAAARPLEPEPNEDGDHPFVTAPRQLEPEQSDEVWDQEFSVVMPAATSIASTDPCATSIDGQANSLTGRPSTFHRLIKQALEIGIDVALDRESESGTTWVYINGEPDDLQRRWVRKLLAIGFKHWPGEGYWK